MTHPIAQLLRQLADAIDGASTTPVGTIIAAAGESPEDRRKRLARDRKRRQRDKSVTYVTPSSVTERDISVTEQRDMSRSSVTGGVGGVVFDSKALFSERAEESKAKGAETTVDSHARESVTERDIVTNVTRVTKRDKQRDSVTSSVTVPIPASHDTPEFVAAWNDWLEHCRRARTGTKRLTQRAAELHMRLLAVVEPAVGIRAIEAAITSGWLKPDPVYLETTHRPGNFTAAQRLSPVEQARAKRAEDTDWSNYRGEAVQ